MTESPPPYLPAFIREQFQRDRGIIQKEIAALDPEQVSAAAREAGEQRRAFYQMLETYVPQVGYHAPEQPRILNLGCGRCREGLPLNSYFGKVPYGTISDKVTLFGVDVDEQELEKARRDYIQADFSGPCTRWIERPNFRFIRGDAVNLIEYFEYNGGNGGKESVDIVVARHPNIAEREGPWTRIFMEAQHVTTKGGLFIATSFSDAEHAILEEAAEYAGWEKLLSVDNRYAISASVTDASVDRKVLLARRGEESTLERIYPRQSRKGY